MASFGRMVLLEIVMVLAILVEYELAIAISVDAIRLALAAFAPVDAIDLLLWMYPAAFCFVWSLMFAALTYRRNDHEHSVALVKAWGATLIAALGTMVAIVYLGLGFLGKAFVMTGQNWALANVAFVAYIMNPGEYIVAWCIVILGYQLFFQAILKV